MNNFIIPIFELFIVRTTFLVSSLGMLGERDIGKEEERERERERKI
jgi:hypothetical protein